MIKINKKVSLDFLGEEYADSYVMLSAIPLREYEELSKQAKEIEESKDNQQAMQKMVDLVKARFQSGSVTQDGKMVDLKVEDIEDMPGEFFINVIKRLSGADPNA